MIGKLVKLKQYILLKIKIEAKMNYMMAEIGRFADMYALSDFKMNPNFPVNTLLAMRAAIIAHSDSVVNIFYPAVQKAMWETGLDISKPEVLASVLDSADLHGESIVARTQDASVKQALIDATQDAARRGLFGLPTWFAENQQGSDEMYFGKDNCWMFGAMPENLS